MLMVLLFKHIINSIVSFLISITLLVYIISLFYPVVLKLYIWSLIAINIFIMAKIYGEGYGRYLISSMTDLYDLDDE